MLGSLIGLLALIFTASGVFTEIEDALNVIWKAPRTESYFYQIVRGRVLSLALVVGLGILLMISMILAGGIGVLGTLLDSHTSLSHFVIGADQSRPVLRAGLAAVRGALQNPAQQAAGMARRGGGRDAAPPSCSRPARR